RSSASAVVLQADGRIVAGGFTSPSLASSAPTTFAIVRYLPDGSADPGFGQNNGAKTGFVEVDFGAGSCGYGQGMSLALQGDGRIVASGFGQVTLGQPVATIVRFWP